MSLRVPLAAAIQYTAGGCTAIEAGIVPLNEWAAVE